LEKKIVFEVNYGEIASDVQVIEAHCNTHDFLDDEGVLRHEVSQEDAGKSEETPGATCCNTLHHNATRCNALQHTAVRMKRHKKTQGGARR